MKAPFKHPVTAPHERQIRILSEQSAVPLGQVRTLFHDEFKRIGMGAKVGSYVAVLTSSSVRGMLRRATGRADAAQHVQELGAAPAPQEQRHLQRWEDDGGRARRAQ
jgi:hypothetical protein